MDREICEIVPNHCTLLEGEVAWRAGAHENADQLVYLALIKPAYTFTIVIDTVQNVIAKLVNERCRPAAFVTFGKQQVE